MTPALFTTICGIGKILWIWEVEDPQYSPMVGSRWVSGTGHVHFPHKRLLNPLRFQSILWNSDNIEATTQEYPTFISFEEPTPKWQKWLHYKNLLIRVVENETRCQTSSLFWETLANINWTVGRFPSVYLSLKPIQHLGVWNGSRH